MVRRRRYATATLSQSLFLLWPQIKTDAQSPVAATTDEKPNIILMPSPNPNFDPNVVAQAGRRAVGRGGAAAGRRRGAAGRGGPRRAQIQERQKELARLEEAFKQNEMEKVGQLVADMKKAMENSPQRARGPRPGNTGGISPRQQREKEIQQLELAQKNADTEKLGALIAEIKNRLENNSAGPTGRGPTGRGPVQRLPGQ